MGSSRSASLAAPRLVKLVVGRQFSGERFSSVELEVKSIF